MVEIVRYIKYVKQKV